MRVLELAIDTGSKDYTVITFAKKTLGTNCLEIVEVIVIKDPDVAKFIKGAIK